MFSYREFKMKSVFSVFVVACGIVAASSCNVVKVKECVTVHRATLAGISLKLRTSKISQAQANNAICNTSTDLKKCADPFTKVCAASELKELTDRLKAANEDPYSCNIRLDNGGSTATTGTVTIVAVAAILKQILE